MVVLERTQVNTGDYIGYARCAGILGLIVFFGESRQLARAAYKKFHKDSLCK